MYIAQKFHDPYKPWIIMWWEIEAILYQNKNLSFDGMMTNQ